MSPLLAAAIGAAAGCFALGSAWPLPAALIASIGITLTSHSRRRVWLDSVSHPPVAHALMAAAVGLTLGAVLSGSQDAGPTHLGLPAADIQSIEGTLITDSRQSGDLTIYRLSAEHVFSATHRADADAEVTVFVDRGERAYVGTAVRVSGVALREEAGVLTAAADRAGVAVLQAPDGLHHIRARAITALTDACATAGRGPAELLTALYLGTTDDLSVRLRTLFRDAGVSHILALSGMHLGVLIAVTLLVVRRLLGLRIASVVAVFAASAFLFVVGPRPSLVRGVIMVAIGVALRIADRRQPLVDLVAAAFLVQLLLAPQSTRMVSFQLSYLALAGIAVIGPEVARIVRSWLPAIVHAPLSAGIGAQLATAPLVLSVFGVVAPAGIAASLILTPLIVAFMLVGAPVVLLSSVTGVAGIAPVVLGAVYRLVEAVAWFFAGIPRIGGTGPAAVAAAGVAVGAVGLLCVVAAARRARAVRVSR